MGTAAADMGADNRAAATVHLKAARPKAAEDMAV